MRPPQAAVFDCDGVLVDSEPHSVRAWLEVLGGLGHPAGAGDVERCRGLGYLPTHRALDRLAPLPEASVLWPALVAALQRSFDTGLERFPDAVGALAACRRAGVALGVASASPRSRLDLTLRAAGLTGEFAVAVSGDEVAHPKPAPDVYRRAARLLDVPPGRCVAVEDAAIGVESALAAGLRVVAVARRPEDRPDLEASGATVVDEITPEALGL